MPHHDEAGAVRPLTLAWVGRHLEVGERIVRTEALHGGITAEMRRLTIRTRDGGTRDLVLRSFVDVEHAEDWLDREAGAGTVAGAEPGCHVRRAAAASPWRHHRRPAS